MLTLRLACGRAKITTAAASRALEMGKKSLYAVAAGRQPGLFRSWEECRRQVDGFRAAKFQGFKSEGEALRYLQDHGVPVAGLSLARGPLPDAPVVAAAGDGAAAPAAVAAKPPRKRRAPPQVAKPPRKQQAPPAAQQQQLQRGAGPSSSGRVFRVVSPCCWSLLPPALPCIPVACIQMCHTHPLTCGSIPACSCIAPGPRRSLTEPPSTTPAPPALELWSTMMPAAWRCVVGVGVWFGLVWMGGRVQQGLAKVHCRWLMRCVTLAAASLPCCRALSPVALAPPACPTQPHPVPARSPSRQVTRVCQYMGDNHTNNQAEYAGLIAGLLAALQLGCRAVRVQGDSTLIINQVRGGGVGGGWFLVAGWLVGGCLLSGWWSTSRQGGWVDAACKHAAHTVATAFLCIKLVVASRLALNPPAPPPRLCLRRCWGSGR